MFIEASTINRIDLVLQNFMCGVVGFDVIISGVRILIKVEYRKWFIEIGYFEIDF